MQFIATEKRVDYPALRHQPEINSNLLSEETPMNKLLFAIAAAAAVIPAASFGATPVPGTFTTSLTQTYTLKCYVNSLSVEKGTYMILVVNPVARAIPQGTTIQLRIVVSQFGRYHRLTSNEMNY